QSRDYLASLLHGVEIPPDDSINPPPVVCGGCRGESSRPDELGTVISDLPSTSPRFRAVTEVCQDRRLPPNPAGSRTAIPSLTHAITGSAVVRPGEALRVGLKVCRTLLLPTPFAE